VSANEISQRTYEKIDAQKYSLVLGDHMNETSLREKEGTEMTYVQTETAIQGEAALTVLTHLREGRIKDATACFAEVSIQRSGDWTGVQGQRALG
jgi:hypothetical protein